jgi:plastocyanin
MVLALCLIVASAAAFAGCGGGGATTAGTSADTAAAPSETPEGQEGKEAGASTEVEMKNTAFDPADLTVKVGDTVKWENYDDFDHNVTADSGADFKSDDFGKDGTFEWTATKPGEVAYECTLHPGMTGTITVEK